MVKTLNIFTGVNSFGRFFDSFRDGEGFTDEEYSDCTRYDYELSDSEIDQRIKTLRERVGQQI
jgi:hypothetical protein